MLIILDRDGVINQDSPDFIKSPDEFIFLSGSVEAIVKLSQAGHRIGVASNQSGIARGHLTEETLQTIHRKMISAVQQYGGVLNDIAYCPHAPDVDCMCRKPKPGMLIAIADKYKVNYHDIIFVGDRLSDIQAAEAIGAQPILVRSTATEPDVGDFYPKISEFDALLAFADKFLDRCFLNGNFKE